MSEKLTDEEFVRQVREVIRRYTDEEAGSPEDASSYLPEALDRIEWLISRVAELEEANAELLEADSVRQSWCDSNLDFMDDEDKARMIDELRTGKRQER